ncbi:sphingoid long-chain base transporter RSB1 [Lophiostoma macrostomum CBS 122681]|uniref:Sphingoid long-chain base transporter RSB1 n=1 Tax=Lophiostoma macrostomum CBS 122681 TaxID=1314788 RepID=A0A6A6T6K6_9PLEO|nr:sphingoid long-chain base transporter RSB1 [Lophiostoma macrostomum CBS 122681]
MGQDYIPAPDWCENVGPECPVSGSLYGYKPNLGANAFFIAVFALCLIAQLALGIRYKTWTYMVTLSLGCLGEAVGYAGRIMLHNNAFSSIGFQIQICCIIIAPAFFSGGIYLTLKHIVLNFGERYSRLRAGWYTWIFIGCDLFSLVLQGAGGGIAATADNGSSFQDVGTDLMVAGIIFQVVCMAFFVYFLGEYSYRTYKHRDELSPESMTLFEKTSFRCFMGGISVAYVAIFTRCVYRIPELTGGWGNNLMRNEAEFIALEGVMIVIAAICLTVFHPGYCFPALGKRANSKAAKQMDESSSTEKMSEPTAYP